ncbi:MAG: undecaprenyl-diphosphate phosphatase [Deltaproteobacteria bacterium]|uniref:Undecaprenyl-diphosphatase n=1 Tax=Candidatus Zymogenus saltonus TaxID=2844893 RepID=A0A9D8KI96_9DELT|nr:undecaprenyl-diphosphate phosphatase [Candidatus Zymogenus saltonus]
MTINEIIAIFNITKAVLPASPAIPCYVAVILGIVQGLTEFLPVSSSGHLVVMQHYLSDFTGPPLPFDVLLHGGTLVSLLIYFFKDIKAIIASFFGGGTEEKRENRKLGWMIILGSVPAGIVGIAFMDFFEALFSNIKMVSFMFLVTAALLLVAEKRSKVEVEERRIGVVDAIVIGLAQAVAIIPGISRSGSTIALGLILGLKRETAARFSFLLSIPAVLGAFILNLKNLDSINFPYIVGVLLAAGVGLLAIKLTINAVVVKKLWIFSLYLMILGVTLVFLNFLF